MPFADLGLSNELLQAVEESGYSEPTPIQAQAIPSVLMMRDIIGIAQTGTGKTASFVLPMIDILAQGRSRARMPRSLILEPTRELAAQVAENFEKYGKYHKLSMGRLMDLFERGNILLTGCSLLVIDEADRMLDMGFIPDIENICTKLPANRQTLLFSATMPPPIKKLADRFLSNPKSIEVARPATAGANIAQMLVPVTERAKRETLRSLLKSEGAESAIVFCNRKTMVRELNKSLQRHGFRSGEIHGDIDQAARIAELDRFKSGEINLLIASDVAARGLDIKGVSHVFNFDAPWHPDDYVHRIGRTGRAGATGKAFTFITSSDAEAVANIEKLIGTKIPRLDMGGQTADEGEETESGRSSSRPAGKDSRKRTGRTAAPKRARGTNVDKEVAAESERAAEPAPREAKPARKETARRPAEDRPARAPQAEDRTDARRGDSTQGRNRPDEEPDDGWNGPMPGFLSVGFTN